MENSQNCRDLQAPVGDELDGIGKWLMKIAQNISRQYNLETEDVYQDAVLEYLKRRKYYVAERGARTTFASMATTRALHHRYKKQRSRKMENLPCDIAVLESRESRTLPDEAFAVVELPRRDRKAALKNVLLGAGWSRTEFSELSISSCQKIRTRVLCSYGD